MFKKLSQLHPHHQAYVLMLIGIILLFHALHIFERGLNMIIIIAAVCMIGYGLLQSGLLNTVQRMLKKYDSTK